MEDAKKIAPFELFKTFATVGLCGFGGVAPWAYLAIVEKKKWLTSAQFGELLSIGQILPGANVTNLSAMLGYRFAGVRGAFAATSGLLGPPFLVILGCGMLYARYGQLHAVQGALRGVTAVAAGLVLSTCYKLFMGQPRTIRAIVVAVATFGAVGILHFPLGWAMLALMPVAIGVEWRLSR
jgi:chromate transporter